MEVRKIKKQLSAACEYAYVKLGLNYYTYYEEDTDHPAEEAGLLHLALKHFLEGNPDKAIPVLDELRSRLTARMEECTSYTDSFQAYEYVVNRLEPRFAAGGADTEHVVDNESLTTDIMGYILKDQDAMGINQRIGSILGQLPVRLTKQKFFAMVEEALRVYKGGPMEGLEDALYALRSQALLKEPKEASKGYERLFALLQLFKQADYRNMTQEVFDSLVAAIAEAGQMMTDMSGDMSLLMELANDLYILCLCREETFMDAILEKNLNELLSGLLELFGKDEKCDIPEALSDRLYALEGRQEACYEQWSLGIGYSDMSAAEKEEEEKLAEIFRKTDLLMSGSAYMKLEKAPESTEKTVDEALLRREEETLFAEITESWKSQPRVVIRAAMAAVLSQLPVFFHSLEETKSYVRSSLDSCSDEYEKAATSYLIHEIMKME
jgi:hypothetical protein